LIAEGKEVIRLDKLIPETTDNIAHLAGDPNFTFTRHKVTNYIFVERKLDYIIHSFCLSS